MTTPFSPADLASSSLSLLTALRVVCLGEEALAACEALSAPGLEVAAAGSLFEAWRSAAYPRTGQPAALICGLEQSGPLLAMLRDSDHLSRTPVVVVSSQLCAEAVRRCLEAGADDCYLPEQTATLARRLRFLLRFKSKPLPAEAPAPPPVGWLDRLTALLMILGGLLPAAGIALLLLLRGRPVLLREACLTGFFRIEACWRFGLTEGRLGRWLQSSEMRDWPLLFAACGGRLALRGPSPLPLAEAESLSYEAWAAHNQTRAGVFRPAAPAGLADH
jgi:CheY-like chemotaxis protein